MKTMTKIVFRLEQDESGYPPSGSEAVWAVELKNGHYKVENIPFYIRGISSGDEIAVDRSEDGLYFRELINPSGNSTFRLLLTHPEFAEDVRRDLLTLGCVTECHKRMGLLAVEIPPSVQIQPFLDYIVNAQACDQIDIEEGALRHVIE